MEKEKVGALEMSLQAAREKDSVYVATVRQEIERGEWSCKIDILWVMLKACVECEWNVAHIGVRSVSLGPMHISSEAVIRLLLYASRAS